MVVPAIGFCEVSDGGRVAYARMGEGPPLVMLPGWLSHVEDVWTHPSAASAREKLAASRTFIWYDRLGCGLSDRSGFTPSLDSDVAQLEAVLDAAGVDRCSLIGYSLSGPAAAVFAARNPDRVSHLVLYSTYARGSAVSSDESFESLMSLLRANWRLGSLVLAAMFLPNGNREDLTWFARFQRRATTVDIAGALLADMRTHDVRAQLLELQCPTLVLTNQHDPAIHPANSREIASLVPDAVLRVLDGNEHDPFIRDSGSVVEHILDFIGAPLPTSPQRPGTFGSPLSRREREVLALLAAGEPNKVIARKMGITVATVERHVGNLYRKLGARGRADAALAAVSLGLVDVPAAMPPQPG